MASPVDLALADLGYTEQPPGSNITKFGDRFFGAGSRSPWCAEMVSCDTRDAGWSGPWSASVGFYRQQATAQGRLTDLSGALAAIAAGKCVSVGWEWEHDSWPDHISWLLGQNFDGSLRTVDGNSPGPDHTDEVSIHNRLANQVAFYCIVDPPAGVSATPPTLTSPEPARPVFVAPPVLPSWMFLTWKPNGRRGFTNHGDKVALFQRRMVTNFGGYWPNFTAKDVDGVIGPTTNDIIGRFQHELGLQVDRVVGQATWAKAFG